MPRRSLAAYRAKRDLATSPEPRGGTPRGDERAFCVQKHLATQLHYDLRLEHRGVLLSWAVPKGPSLDSSDKRLAMRVEDHPYDYGGFEGVIPSGYGAGIVLLWDRGTWQPLDPDVDGALERGELKFALAGTKLRGEWVLVRTSGRYGAPREEGQPSRSWLLIKHRDRWAGAVDVIARAPLSVKSGGDFADILAQERPDLWASDRPSRGGAAGAMLRQVIARAAQLRSARPAPKRTTRR
jgi:bifunctional non-homologous end joining protein LigD